MLADASQRGNVNSISSPETDPISDPSTDPISDPNSDPFTDPNSDLSSDPAVNPAPTLDVSAPRVRLSGFGGLAVNKLTTGFSDPDPDPAR